MRVRRPFSRVDIFVVVVGLWLALAPIHARANLQATLATDAGGNLTLRWQSESGKYYRIETSDDLANWTPVAGEYAGTGSVLAPVVRAAGASGGPRLFWRVVGAAERMFFVTYAEPAELELGTPMAALPAQVTTPNAGEALSFSVSVGALPPGLSLDPATGAVSGLPLSAGSYAFAVTMTNGTRSATVALRWVVELVADGSTLFWDATPPSTLLPAGATTLAFTVKTRSPGQCRYSVGTDAGYAAMTPFDAGQGTTEHAVVFRGLNPDTQVVNHVYVRCDADLSQVIHLRYRALPAANPGFPRKANLWGSNKIYANGGLPHCARLDLYLGSYFTEAQAWALRALKPSVLLLDSITTVSIPTSVPVPENFWLHDTAGSRIETWPGEFRLNLTRSDVAVFMARYAYKRMLEKNLSVDGMFFDNFFTSYSWATTDYTGRAVQLDADNDGIADDGATFDAAWKSGVYLEANTWRKLMPYAYTSGHLSNTGIEELGTVFNGDSMLFDAQRIKDGVAGYSFLSFRKAIDSWWVHGRTPVLVTVESAPPDEISYGYGYRPWTVVPPATIEFARTYYSYMRWGLGLSLLNDAFFFQDFGDMAHGWDWWYDELDCDLGQPSGPAYRLDLGAVPTTSYVANGGFEEDLAANWYRGLVATYGAAGNIVRDTGVSAVGSASCRIDVSNAGNGTSWHVALLQKAVPLLGGVTYDLSFKIRSDSRHSVWLNLQKSAADWRSYGLSQTVVSSGPEWQDVLVTFTATETASDGRLGFNVGSSAGSVWVDDVKLVQHPPDVFRRDFDHGAMLLNASDARVTVPVAGSYRRLTGTQAPRYQYIVDDADAAFAAGSWASASYDSGLWKAAGPYFHDWGAGCHESSSTTDTASWDLGIRADDVYTLDVWWPAATAASGWSSAVRYEVVVGGTVVVTATFDQTTGGDQWHRFASVALTKAAGAQVRITNLQAKPAIADAILVQSTARFNNGSDAPSVELDAKDAIILVKK